MSFEFDGVEDGESGGRGSKDRVRGSEDPCGLCGEPMHEHDKERDYSTGPAGAYSYNYLCP